jgi:L-lactate dehydrogenase complex protein LldF
VKINIPRHLINLRRDIQRNHLDSPIERAVYRLWAWGMRFPFLYGLIGTLQKWDLRRRARKTGGWVQEMPSVAAGWTQVRDMPAPAAKTFHELWRGRR